MEPEAQTRVARHGEKQGRQSIGGLAIGAGLLFGVGTFVVIGFLMGLDYFSVRGVPTERAVVISVGPSGTEVACGPKAVFPNTPGKRTIYRSFDPPAGLPSQFYVDHCPEDGDPLASTVSVRRTGASPDDVYVDPIESVGQWLGMAGIAGVAVGLGGAAVVSVREAWSIHRATRRARRRRERVDEVPGCPSAVWARSLWRVSQGLFGRVAGLTARAEGQPRPGRRRTLHRRGAGR